MLVLGLLGYYCWLTAKTDSASRGDIDCSDVDMYRDGTRESGSVTQC